MSKLIIHATNVHQGGGESLLKALFKALEEDKNVLFCLDERMRVPESIASFQIRKTKPNIVSRLIAEWWLKRNVVNGDVVLCFGNLPPLFRLSGFVVVFLQNRYLLDGEYLNNFPFLTRLRITIERFWFAVKTPNVDEFLVQTNSMKRLMLRFTKGNVHVLPFMHGKYSLAKLDSMASNMCDFLYVASGEPHKNHSCLVEAWCELAKQGIFPTLQLTLDERVFPELCGWIDQMVETHDLKIKNLGKISYENIFQAYKASGALIYPSKFESFGLPLLEANQLGLPILASELDYVRDVVKPNQTFDPNSAVSIARAVKRHLNITEEFSTILDANDFVQSVVLMAKNK